MQTFGSLSLAALTLTALACANHAPTSESPAPSTVEPDAPEQRVGPEEDGPASPAPVTDVSRELEVIRAKHGLVALAGAAVNPSGVIAIGAAGVRKQGDTAQVTADDRWHLGSDTKAMTATLAAVLVEEGKVSWDQSVVDAFPGFASRIDPAFREVTLVELLTQTAGLPPNLLELNAIWSHLRADAQPLAEQRAWFAEQVLTMKPLGKPGEFGYANSNYIVAGAMLEATTGQTWEQLIRERLFVPLEMKSCGFGAPGTAGASQPDEPWGHVGGETVSPVPPGPNADNPRALGPAGTVHCSLRDWAKFIALHLSGAKQDTKLLPQSAFARLHSPPAPTSGGYAYGWLTTERTWAGGKALFHNGTNTMFYATAWLAPEKSVAYLAVTNQMNGEATDEAVAWLIQTFPAP